MNVEQERRALEILEEALERPEREREGFIHQTCEGDDALHRRVMELLGASSGGGSFEEPLFDIHNSEPLTEKEIGPYRLLNALGRGGMGIIYLAERKDFEQKVAIKVIRHGLDLDPVLVRRFHNERQILARLEHPHIARLLDGGTTRESLPYFVMEYVEGDPIDSYCQSRNLSLRERLLLFQKVCTAVQFAHRNLVIHRDLKPANILINDQGEPKLLDFGIAKLLDDNLMAAPLATATGQGPMTPRYASPEQVRMEVITTASDVYSLGVLLYELLTGVSPYRVDTDQGFELAQAVCDQEPRRPSTSASEISSPTQGRPARQELRGDLDSITLKALGKQLEDRYGSVEQLHEDIERHLNGRPVSARAGTWQYLGKKFIYRNRLAVTTTTVILCLLLASTTFFSHLRREAREAQATSKLQAARAAATNDLLKQLFREISPDAEGGPATSSLAILKRAKQVVLEGSLEDPIAEADIAGTIAELLRDVGEIQDARDLLEQAVAAAKKAYPSPHPEILKHLQNLAVLHYDHDQLDVAEKNHRDLLNQRLQLGHPENKLFKLRSNLASVLLRQGQVKEAEEIYLDVYQRRRELYEVEYGPHDEDIATSRHNLAALYLELNQLDKAETYADRAIESRRLGDEPSELAASLDVLGRILLDQGKPDEARQKIEEALSIRQRIFEKGHSNIAKSQSNLAETWIDSNIETAETHLLVALEVLRAEEDQRSTASAESILGLIYLKTGNLETAGELLTASHRQLESTGWPETRIARKALVRFQQYQQQTDQD